MKTPAISVEDAAKRLQFPGGRNGLYKFLRSYAGFQGTIPPRNLIRSRLFQVKDTDYQCGPVRKQTQVTKVTTEGLTFIAQLMADNLPKQEIQG